MADNQTVHASQSAMLEQGDQKKLYAFLARNDISGDTIQKVGVDASRRRCLRVSKTLGSGQFKTYICIDSVPDDSHLAIPGHKISDFIRIGRYLKSLHINVPEIYDTDEECGYLLLDDFGDINFADAAAQKNDPKFFYSFAANVLQDLQQKINQDTAGDTRVIAQKLGAPNYYESHIHEGRRRIVDWYRPAMLAVKNDDGMAEDYFSVWDDIERELPDCPQNFCHIDYHFGNLMWMESLSGLRRCGILDFQGAMVGPCVYDVVNLLEDARIKVPDDIKSHVLFKYTSQMTAAETDVFRKWYKVIALQFHCRVIGQFIKLAVVDNKNHYLDHIPLLQDYITQSLEDEMFYPLKEWFSKQKIRFNDALQLEPKRIQDYIRSDAF